MDFGSEGRGLQRGDYYFILVRMFLGGCNVFWYSDLKDRPGVRVVGYVRGPLGGTRVR